jgi:hypothetical protein
MFIKTRVAMLIPDLDFYPSWITNLGSRIRINIYRITDPGIGKHRIPDMDANNGKNHQNHKRLTIKLPEITDPIKDKPMKIQSVTLYI